MATILVDFENVHTLGGLKGVEYLNSNDTLHIFYSEVCEKIKGEDLDYINDTGCALKLSKLLKTGKNALDFYIATECGFLCNDGEEEIVIISKDKGFSAVLDYIGERCKDADRRIFVESNIERGLAKLNNPKDADRRRVIAKKMRTESLDEIRTKMIKNDNAAVMEHKTLSEKRQGLFKKLISQFRSPLFK